MKSVVGLIVALGVVVSVSAAPQKPGEQTWKGKISDSNCKDKHPAGEHEGKKMTDADCTGICVKKGAKYVFVSDGKVFQIANQESKQIASSCRPAGRTDRHLEGGHHHRDDPEGGGEAASSVSYRTRNSAS